MSGSSFIPYGRQNITEEDIDSIITVLKSDFLTQGPAVQDFEKEICKVTDSKYCVVVSNGTAALHLAVLALDLPENSIGHTTTNTFVASANCMSYCNLKTKLVDIDSETFNIDLEKLEESYEENSRLVVPVHFAGRAVDMENLSLSAKKHNIKIIEDASHALGSKYADGSPVGNCKYSDLTTFSFHPVKTVTSGEGGAITTNSEELYKKLCLLRTHGIEREGLKNSHGSWYYQMTELGFNFRITDIQAALGLSQIKRISQITNRRQEIVKKYNSSFRNIDWITPPSDKNDSNTTFHLYILRFDHEKLGLKKDEIILHLRERNIGTQIHYIPVHLQKYYQEKFNYKEGDFPAAESYYHRALSIPLYPTMTDSDVEYVIEEILKLKGIS